jgi:hypothetical protein
MKKIVMVMSVTAKIGTMFPLLAFREYTLFTLKSSRKL